MRYIAMKSPKAWTSESHCFQDRPTCNVVVASKEPEDTGLLDQNGLSIYRVHDFPIDFGFRGS
jgi:hypothetical protein